MIGTIKDLSNILFFGTVSLVTVLSYLQARKTLFAPIRTETFKLQLKAFEELLLFFQNKTETDFTNALDLDRIASLNTLRMADEYVAKFFDGELKPDKKARDETYKPLIGGIVSKEYMAKYFEKIDAQTPVGKPASEEKKIKNPALILANWQKYEHGMVEYTKEFDDLMRELTRLSASPLLPKPLREYIGEFRNLAHDNLVLIGEAITACAQNMPEHFPVADDMKTFSPNWVWNEYNERSKPFEPVAKKILDYMNNYLRIESLME